MFLTQHVSMGSEVPSPFASMATSLLQVLAKASKKTSPRIALINMQHPTMQEPHKVLHASKVLPWLKQYNQALWARYKGHAGKFDLIVELSIR